VAIRPACSGLVRPGDLIFFGRPQRCTHVGCNLGKGRYLHSFRSEHVATNRAAVDQLAATGAIRWPAHYRSELRGAAGWSLRMTAQPLSLRGGWRQRLP